MSIDGTSHAHQRVANMPTVMLNNLHILGHHLLPIEDHMIRVAVAMMYHLLHNRRHCPAQSFDQMVSVMMDANLA